MVVPDIDRLRYKPNINITKEVYTKYDGDINSTSVNKDTPLKETVYSADPYENTTPVLKDCLINNLGISLKKGYNSLKYIDNALLTLRSNISKNSEVAYLLDGVDSGDLNALDKYIELSENISGGIDLEVYPVLLNVRNDIKRFIEYINTKLFNNTIDYDNIDDFISKYHNAITDTIELEKRILSNEESDGYVDYRMYSIDTQLYGFIDERLRDIVNFADDLINVKSLSNKLSFIPPEQDVLNDYFDSTKEECDNNMERMCSFDSTDVIYILIDRIYNQRKKVKRNRDVLLSADKKSFFSMLPIAKNAEVILDEYMLDLYKAKLCDIINKGDYLNSLLSKDNIRQYIINSIQQ